MALILDVRIDGFEDPIGALVRADNDGLSFAYDLDYAQADNAYSLSLSMPLTDEPYEDQRTRAFFGNLLQERDGPLQRVMDREGLARNNIAGLLFHLGADCPGAISVLPQGSPPAKVPGDYAKDYRIIENDRLEQIVRALQSRQALPDDSVDPSPLAGVQSKLAITRLPAGQLAEPLPGSGAPTTHILKVPDATHKNDAALENAAMRLASATGFVAAETNLVKIAGIECLLITRFDRAIAENGLVVRLHQEDFAQAIGLPASLKYERHGAPGRRFDVKSIYDVLQATAVPSEAINTFLQSTIFDLLVGNVDAHAKNFALIHRPYGRTHLAPRYDILPTRLDPTLTNEFAYSVGNAKSFDQLTANDIYLFLSDLGISSPKARKRIAADHISRLTKSLISKLDSLDREGRTKTFADMIAANIQELLEIMAMPASDQVGKRDAFIPRGGGWLLGS